MTCRVAALFLWASTSAWPQHVLTPTPDRPDDLHEAGGYTISNSIEAGYRFATVGGNEDVYRATVNYGNGVRLFESELRIDSLDGKGKWLDEFAFNTHGAPGDPYQSAVVRAEKRALYRYNLQLRAVDYYNRLPALWEGEHGLRTQRTWQSHDLTLFPDRRVEVLLGYDRNKRTGLGFFTEGIPDSVGDFSSTDFLRFATDIRQVTNQYRAGVNLRVLGLALTATQALDRYKEETAFQDASTLPGLLPNVQPVDAVQRTEPFHGTTHITQVAVRTEKERWIGFQGRFAYADGNRQSVLNETVTARGVGDASTLRHTFVSGDADRTQGSGEFTVTFLPSEKWTLTHTVVGSNARFDGSVDFLEVSLFANQFLRFEHLGIRHLSSSTEANYRPTAELGFYGVYRHATRRVRTKSVLPDFGFELPLFGVDNNVDIGGGGVRWMPIRGVRASFDIEVGRADQPLTPVSDRKFHNERARIRWRRRSFSASGYFRNETNNSPTLLTDYSSARRSAGAHLFWSDSDGKVTLDGGYSWLHADSSAGIFNLIDPGTAARTVYESNLHTLNFSSRMQLTNRVLLSLGYMLTKDTGDGRTSTSISGDLTPTYPSFSFDGANFFVSLPLTYQSPQVRLSISISDRLAWNAGWQFYDYAERFTGEQNYHAHVGYSSLRWSF